MKSGQALSKQVATSTTNTIACLPHNKKYLNQLEECYWAKWKPSKTGTTKSTLQRIPAPHPAMDAPCANCRRLLLRMQCQHCYKTTATQTTVDLGDLAIACKSTMTDIDDVIDLPDEHAASPKSTPSEETTQQLLDEDEVSSMIMVDEITSASQQLIMHMQRLSKCIPNETDVLVQEMASLPSAEPLQEIKRQAERVLQCALEAEAERQRTASLAVVEEPSMELPIHEGEPTLLQQQQSAEEQRRQLEEQAREYQRQRDLQKKQALRLQQEEQLRELERTQRLEALTLRLQQEHTQEAASTQILDAQEQKDSPRKIPFLYSAVSRVTGVLLHSYPLARNRRTTQSKAWSIKLR